MSYYSVEKDDSDVEAPLLGRYTDDSSSKTTSVGGFTDDSDVECGQITLDTNNMPSNKRKNIFQRLKERRSIRRMNKLNKSSNKAKRSKKCKQLLHFFIALFWISIVLFVYLRPSVEAKLKGKKHSQKKNIIFMVTDGMGPASLSLARSFRQFTYNLPIDDVLFLDHHLIGASRTRSFDSLVTDSAAGATAFACALKSYNGAIGVDPNQTPCGTILEALKLQNYLTGLVVTTGITDATPGAFSAHADYRYQQSLIAQQQLGYNTTLGRSVDLIIGGGRCYYEPMSTTGSCRKDEIDLIEVAQRDGWTYAGNREEFDLLQKGENVTLPLLSLLADYNIPYDIDRDSSIFPSLEEEVVTALTALSKATEDSEQGFFLLIEGSRIDHAGHDNDPAAQVREVLAYDKAFKAVLDFADNSDVETFIISTSDHETGGLVTARQVSANYPDYLWKPEVLLNAKSSGEKVSKDLLTFASTEGVTEESLKTYIKKDILERQLGIYDYSEEDVKNLISPDFNKQYYLNNMVSLRSQTGWTTHGHSAVDVNIYGYSNTKRGMGLLYEHLGGNHENIEMGKFMETIGKVDLSKVTELLVGTDHKVSSSQVDAMEEQHDAYGHAQLIHH